MMHIDSSYIIGLILSVILVFGSFYILYSQLVDARRFAKEKVIEYTKLLSQKKSSEVRLGQISEQLVPFLDKFKHDPKNAHFIGMPIDYIVFNNDEIVFIEVKSGGSTLSKKQSEIKKLINSGKVRFETIRIN